MFIFFAIPAIVGVAVLGALFACFYVSFKRAARSDDRPTEVPT